MAQATLTRARPRAGLLTGPLLVVVTASFAIPLTGNRYVLAAHALFVVLIAAIAPVIWRSGMLLKLWLAAGVWSVAQLLSSDIHHTELVSVTGLMGPLIALVVSGLVWLHEIEGVSRASVLLAMSIGWIGLVTWSLPADNPWKFALATPVTVAFLAWAWKRGMGKPGVVLGLLVLAAASLAFDSRFYFALHLMVAFAIMVTGRLGRKHEGREPRSRRRLVVFAALSAVALYFAYPAIALSGTLGERAQLQQELYEAGGDNFLLANRAEMPQALYLVAQHPWTGIGANAQLSTGDAYGALGFVAEAGVPLDPEKTAYLLGLDDAHIGYASHSAALDSAIQAGVWALLFWVFVLWVLARAVLRDRSTSPGGTALLWFVVALTFWNALFSPLDVATYLCLTAAVFLAATQPATRASERPPPRGNVRAGAPRSTR